MLEGQAGPIHDETMHLDVTEENQRRLEMDLVLGRVNLDAMASLGRGETPRFFEERHHTEAYMKLMPLGGDPSEEKEGVGGPFRTFKQTTGEMLQQVELYAAVDLGGEMMNKLFEVLTIDVERETYSLQDGEIPLQRNFKIIHDQAVDVEETWDAKEVDKIKKHARLVIKDTDVGLCVEMPPPLAEHHLSIMPVFDHLGKRCGEAGLTTMPRPVQCSA